MTSVQTTGTLVVFMNNINMIVTFSNCHFSLASLSMLVLVTNSLDPYFPVLVTILNCCSTKWSSRLQAALTVLKLIPLVFILVGGLYNIGVGEADK
jgi:amino acid transporter